MAPVLRPLLPVISVALLLMARLVLWIRLEPVDQPRAAQVLLSLLLVLMVGVLSAVVRWVEHDTQRREHGRGQCPHGP